MDEDEKSILIWSAVAGFFAWLGFSLTSAKATAEKQSDRAAEDARIRYEHLIDSSGEPSSSQLPED